MRSIFQALLKRINFLVILLMILGQFGWAVGNASASAFTVARVSVSSSGVKANDESIYAEISADGRYVVFQSSASNLVDGDTNERSDVFVRDLLTGTTIRVSVNSIGEQGNGYSGNKSSISGDGRYVVFCSRANNLVTGDSNGVSDVFVHDLQTGLTRRVSVDSSGNQANNESCDPIISTDGRFVAFPSFASNLIDGDTNGERDIFVHDLQTGITSRASIDSSGGEGNSYSKDPSISDDGRFLAFWSLSNNLVEGDTNDVADIFVHDYQTGLTSRVSVSSSGEEGNGESEYSTSISPDGRLVTFCSIASNLVTGDTNGVFDVFIHDLQTGITSRISVDSSGSEGNAHSLSSEISDNGRYIVFDSWADNLANGDLNETEDVFVHDLETGNTSRVSVQLPDVERIYYSVIASISADGSQVVFQSAPSNPDDGDVTAISVIFVASNVSDVPDNLGAISGTVQNEDGAPLSGKQVQLLDGNDNVLEIHKTNGSGNYSFTDIPEGDYVISAMDDCYQCSGGYADQYYPNVHHFNLATRLPVFSGQRTENIDFVLERWGIITGVVKDSEGNPIANAEVTAFATTDGWGFGYNGRTRENGNFDFLAAPGEYRVSVRSENYIEQYYLSTPFYDEAQLVTVFPGLVTSNINFILKEWGSISGIIFNEIGEPLDGIPVSAIKYESEYIGNTISNIDGSFTISNLPVGEYCVTTQSSGYYYKETYNDAYDCSTADRVTVVSDQTTENIDFILQAQGVISGTITDTSGNPIENADVIASGWPSSFNTKTMADGSFRLYVKPGDYTVYSEASTYARRYYPNVYTMFEFGSITIDTAEEITDIDITLEAGATITGTILDDDLNPVPENTYICAYKFGRPRYEYSGGCVLLNEDGSYTLSDLAPFGTILAVSTNIPPYDTIFYGGVTQLGLAEEIVLSPGITVTGIDIILPREIPKGTISGTVHDALGLIVPDVWVCISDLEIRWCGTTDEMGGYNIELPEGNWIVFAMDNIYWRSVYYNNAYDLNSANPVHVSAGENTTGIDFTIGVDITTDTDGDGFPDSLDNAPNIYNPDQRDVDDDGMADVLDPCPADETNACDQDSSIAVVIGEEGGTVITENEKVTFSIPTGTIIEPISFSITESGGGYEVVSEGNPLLVVNSYSIQPSGTVFDPPASLTFKWDDADNDGIVDGTSLQEGDLVLLKDGLAISLPCGENPSCDQVSNLLTVEISSLSLFELAISLNNPPILQAVSAPVDPYPVNTTVDATATFLDPDFIDTHTAVWDWGDGTSSTGAVNESIQTVSGSHVYTSAGVYTIKLTLTDAAGEIDELWYRYVVIYDTSAGFVTGGGWFDSPAGAFLADPSLTGKATFGFVSKYQKGATIPTGRTEFQFKVAGFTFSSTSYDWLVIAGAKAQYKGVGMIDGSGSYRFILTAIDGQISGGGGVDKFRIKIWNPITDQVIYDNQSGFDDDSVPSTVITGGSIVIHK